MDGVRSRKFVAFELKISPDGIVVLFSRLLWSWQAHMAAPTESICEVCRERPATHHVCDGGTGRSRALCNQCFQLAAPPDVIELVAAVHDARCQYCGGQPCASGTDMFALITGAQKQKYMCMPCSAEYHGFLHEQLSLEAAGLSQQEQLAVLRKLIEEADAHMRQWVSEKDSR